MKGESAKVNFRTLIVAFFKTYFNIIKYFFISLVFLLTGLVIWIIISTNDQGDGYAVKDYTSSVCWNFNFLSNKKTYLPSDIITLSGSCDSANGTEAFCPFWNITSTAAKIHVLHDDAVQDAKGCNRKMQIQVVNFKSPSKRVHLLAEFNYPKNEPVMEITIEKNDDGEFCRQSTDCHFLDQFCPPSGNCSCNERWIFIRSVEKCVPAVFKVKDHCQFSAQCRIPKTTCHHGSCECSKYYTPDLDSTQCVLEEIYEVNGECQFTSQCKIPKSVCHNGKCECIKDYIPNSNFTQCIPEAIYKIKERCQLTTQCKIPESICHNGKCECFRYYTPDFNFAQCIPEGKDCGDSCIIDENCQIKNRNSVCKMNRCECVESYYSRRDHSYDSRKNRYPKSAASSKAGFGWTIVLLVIPTIHIIKNKIRNYTCFYFS